MTDYTLPLYLLITLFIADIVIVAGKWSQIGKLERKIDSLIDWVKSKG